MKRLRARDSQGARVRAQAPKKNKTEEQKASVVARQKTTRMNIEDIPEKVREMLDGEGAEPQTFTAWVNEMSAAERSEIFGETKAAQWAAGNATQREMLDQRSRPKTFSRT